MEQGTRQRQKLHGKGRFAVRPSPAHGKGFRTATVCPLCHAGFHCRVLSCVFAVPSLFAVRCSSSLPCSCLCRAFLFLLHGNDCFAVREHTAIGGCTAAAVFPVVPQLM
jgi:hypothetical protein